VKFALGLFENPYADEKKESSAFLHPEAVSPLEKSPNARSFFSK